MLDRSPNHFHLLLLTQKSRSSTLWIPPNDLAPHHIFQAELRHPARAHLCQLYNSSVTIHSWQWRLAWKIAFEVATALNFFPRYMTDWTSLPKLKSPFLLETFKPFPADMALCYDKDSTSCVSAVSIAVYLQYEFARQSLLKPGWHYEIFGHKENGVRDS